MEETEPESSLLDTNPTRSFAFGHDPANNTLLPARWHVGAI